MNGAQLTKAVMTLIQARGGKAINLIAASKSGHADIIACYEGRYLELEIKGKGDKEKPHQAAKLNEAIAAGGYGGFVHTVEDALKLLQLIEAGLPCPAVKTTIVQVTL